MPGWSDMFGAPPRALTDEELLSAVQPLPLRPLDIAPEAPAALGTANPFGQGPASPARTYSSDNYGAPLSIPFDQPMASLSSSPLRPLNYADTPGNPANDRGLNISDDWQKRGRDTAAMALSILYPQNGPNPVAVNQLPNTRGQVQQTTNGARALSQMQTDPAWQQEMKKAEGGFQPQMYDANRKGDYTIGYGHHIASQSELSSYRGRTISQNEGEHSFNGTSRTPRTR